jgi:hypothetical protein
MTEHLLPQFASASASGESTESCADFRDGLNNRDGTCIFTDAPGRFCIGAHILPHSKGSEVGLSSFPSSITSFCANFFSCLLMPLLWICFMAAQRFWWGIPQATEAIQSLAGSSYYDKMLGDPSGEDINGENDTTLLPTPTATARARLRASRHDQPKSHTGISTMAEAMDFILLLWSHSAPGHHEELPAIQKEEEDLGRERVNAWLQTQ